MSLFDRLNNAVQRSFAEKSADPETLAVEWLDAPERVASGIYDSRHFVAQDQGETGVSQLITAITVDLAKTGAIAPAERLIVRGIQYRVKDQKPDGQGFCALELELDEEDEGP